MDIYNGTDLNIMESDMQLEYFQVFSKDEMQKMLSAVDIDDYIRNSGIDPELVNKFGVVDVGQVSAINSILREDNLQALKTWKMVELARQYMRFVVHGYPQLDAYETVDYSPEEEQVLNEIRQQFSQETDPIYVETYYSAQMDEKLIAMCDDIKEGYRTLIGGATWLSEGTREGLLKKLENIVYVTGSNLKRHDAKEYEALDGGDYFEFYLNYMRMLNARQIGMLTEESDPKSVIMPMQTVNACYSPSSNNITITVAIMNAPFFDMEADYYTNLGGLGAVIAHEMGHAFDSNNIVIDADGKYDPSWLEESDLDKLEARNTEAVRYFEDNFTIFGVYHVDGEQTLGENYADLGGMECVTSLAHTKEERELLFENYARIWSEKIVDLALLNQIDSDVHAPSMIRTNAILSTLNAFYETYDVKEGDGMYIAPEKRITRW